MLAELAAANAAFSVIKTAVQNGGEIGRFAAQIGNIVTAKETLQRKVNDKKASHQTTDFEEFMALESIREQEKELQQIMLYVGRPNLWNDWQKFQADARVARRDAERAAKQKRGKVIEIFLAVLIVVFGVAGLALAMWWLVEYDKAKG